MPILSSHEIFSLAEQLPKLSAASVEIVSHIDNPRTSRERIVELVKADSQVFAECFKQANSAAIASSREYKTINEIVDVLGFNHIKKVALFLSAKSMISEKEIWFESVFTAIAAQYLALKAGYDRFEADKVYMAALFLNFGAFILKKSFPMNYARISKIDDYRERVKMEREEFGISSAEISALVLSDYGLPEYVTSIIQLQADVYSLAKSPENAFIEIARIMSTIQNLDIDRIYKALDTDEIKSVVAMSGISVFTLSQESVDNIDRQTKDLVRS